MLLQGLHLITSTCASRLLLQPSATSTQPTEPMLAKTCLCDTSTTGACIYKPRDITWDLPLSEHHPPATFDGRNQRTGKRSIRVSQTPFTVDYRSGCTVRITSICARRFVGAIITRLLHHQRSAHAFYRCQHPHYWWLDLRSQPAVLPAQQNTGLQTHTGCPAAEPKGQRVYRWQEITHFGSSRSMHVSDVQLTPAAVAEYCLSVRTLHDAL